MGYTNEDVEQMEKLMHGAKDDPRGQMYDCVKCSGPTFNAPPKLCDKCQGVLKDAILSDQEKIKNRQYSKNKPCPCGSLKNFKNCHARYSFDGSALFLDGVDVTNLWTRSDGDKLIIFQNGRTRERVSWDKTTFHLFAAEYID